MELGLADSAADECEDAFRTCGEWAHRGHDQPAVRRQRRLLDRRNRRGGGGRDGGGVAGRREKTQRQLVGRLDQMARGPLRKENAGGGCRQCSLPADRGRTRKLCCGKIAWGPEKSPQEVLARPIALLQRTVFLRSTG